MELVVHIDANERTRSMLGIGSKADFMQGFLFELFVFKFDSCVKYPGLPRLTHASTGGRILATAACVCSPFTAW